MGLRKRSTYIYFKVPLGAPGGFKNPQDFKNAPSLWKVTPAFHVLVQLQKSRNN